MSGATLESNADYGKLPFDIFCSVGFACSWLRSFLILAQEPWNLDSPTDSWEQWEQIVWEWQELTLMERWV